jgi:dihydropyrimidinase
MKKVIRGGTVVNARETVKGDVLIDGEQIVAVGQIGAVEGAEEIDATGCFLLPGLIDNHTHMSMPFGGTTTADDYDTGTQAAAAGGVTAIVDFALQMEDNGLQSSLDQWMGRAEGTAHVDYGFHMAVTRSDEGTFRDMPKMVDQGVSSFKVFLAYKNVLMITDDLFMRVLEESKEHGGLVQVHAENGWIIDRMVAEALGRGDTAPIWHARTRPEWVEAEATGRAVRFAEQADAPVFIVHVSCTSAAQEIIAGRARGVAAYGETCIQYLFTDISDLERPAPAGARFVCSPPIRDAVHQPFMWDCLKYGHLQSISTDHCPFDDAQKALGKDDFSKIPNGLACIQHRLPLMWEHGVREGRISMNRLVDVCSTAIAKTFGITTKGAISPGMDADVVIFDPATPFTFSTATSFMNVDYDLFDGTTVHGSVRSTLCRGSVVFDRGAITTQPGHGRFLKRQPFDMALQGDVAG